MRHDLNLMISSPFGMTRVLSGCAGAGPHNSVKHMQCHSDQKMGTPVRKKRGSCMAFLLTITISRYFQPTYFPKQLRNHVPLLSSCKIIIFKALYVFSLAWVLVSVLHLDASNPNFC